MKLSNESIFLSGIRSFFNTLLGTVGVLLALMVSFILFSILMPKDHRDGMKNKLEILPNLNGDTKILPLNTPVILRLDVEGIIGKLNLTSENFICQLIESRKGFLKKDRVKGILLYINSPGGAATDSDTIYHNLITYKEKYNVPIFAFVDGMCASGGFYIACSSNKIYASPMSMIGSVGALSGPFFNISELLDNWGVKTATITQGKDKDMMNPFRPWTKDEDQSIKEINDYIYQRFVGTVAASRNINKDKIINDYGAHVFDCQKAKELGYIDVANVYYDDALTSLLKEANIDSSKPYQVVTLSPKKKWYHPFMNQSKTLIQEVLKHLITSATYVNTN